MRPARSSALLLLALLASPSAVVRAAEDDAATTAPPEVPPPASFVTEHSGVFGERTVRYRAVAGETHLTDEAGEPVAALFSVAYVEADAGAERPVTFVFNGGPGSASVWLHMGMFGPERVRVASDADEDDGAAPWVLEPNPATLLDVTDLVFVDPIGTGFSRVVGVGKTEDFWSLEGDAGSLAQFIRRWITEHERWNAPKYLIGESFGTTRAALIAKTLGEDGQDVALNGIVMVSQAMDYTGSTPSEDNLISYVTYLPSMAATARYHGRAGAGTELEAFVQDARDFAVGDYLPALFRGSALEEAERTRIATELSRFTGLDREYVLRSDLRVRLPRFQKELLRDRGLTVGRLDGRYTADEADDVADTPRLGDAASNAISSAYTAALNHYLRTELGVRMDRPYLTSNRAVGQNWNYRPVPLGQSWEPSYVNTARALSDALRKNGELRVLVANGYYDLVTPFLDAEYTLGRHGILRDRIEMTYYEAGHMMYVHEPAFEALMRDVRSFYAR
jgi:carboxypeptidase C (cathepsin A)